MNTIIPIPEIQQRIHVVRGKRVITDADLARFYGVGTRDLNKAVSRNPDRFPEDFCFHLTPPEASNLMFQTGTSSSQHGGRRKVTRVFTEQGVAMLASVLRGDRAAAMSIATVRAFVELRELLANYRELAVKLSELERKLEGHDSAISNLFEAIRQLLASPEPEHSRKIGFHRGNR
jgi:hypothetical protein